MRIAEISAAGQTACAVHSPWSERRLHRTRPTGRLTRLQVSDRPRGAGRQRSCRGRRASSCASVPGSGCAGRRRGVILRTARRIPSGLVEGSGISGEVGCGRRLGHRDGTAKPTSLRQKPGVCRARTAALPRPQRETPGRYWGAGFRAGISVLLCAGRALSAGQAAGYFAELVE